MHTSACNEDRCGSSTSGRACITSSAIWVLILVGVILQGCGGAPRGTISGIHRTGGAALGVAGIYQLEGDSICGKVRIDFGDGSAPTELTNYDFANYPGVSHTYSGWGGKKIVTGSSLENCAGYVRQEFIVTPRVLSVGYQGPRPSPCDPVNAPADASGVSMPMPLLRTGTKVIITSLSNAKMNFGCSFDGCIYDADGKAEAATAEWPFPGKHPFSLVLRVGSRTYQGGKSVSFTTVQPGNLEVCQNDTKLDDNTFGWGIGIEVEEPPPPVQ